jgi:hypothetical protein
MRRTPLFVAVGGLLAMGALVAVSRPGRADPACHQIIPPAHIHAAAIVPGQGGCPATAIGCTAGVFDHDPLLGGTTLSVADGFTPTAGMPGVEQPTTFSFHTIYTITTDAGSISFNNTGIFDSAAGMFGERYIVVSGTGAFQGATGFMLATGRGTTAFDTTNINGEICLQQ